MADEMGLGKTLTMIALIALNQKSIDKGIDNAILSLRRGIKTTLIIAPIGCKLFTSRIEKANLT